MPQMVVQYPDQVASPMGVPPVRPAGSRFSPLYCAYNGFLLGQFLALGFEQGALPLYALRRRSVLALLDEVGVPASLPEERPGLGSDLHIEMLETLVPRLAQRSQLFADHVVLGSLLAHYGMLAAGHPLTAGTLHGRDRGAGGAARRCRRSRPSASPPPTATSSACCSPRSSTSKRSWRRCRPSRRRRS